MNEPRTIQGGRFDGLTCRTGRHYWEVGGEEQVEEKVAGREMVLIDAAEPVGSARCLCEQYTWAEYMEEGTP